MTPEKAARLRRPSQAELATQAGQTTGDIGRRVERGVSLADPLNGNLADARPCPHRSVPYTPPGEDSLRGALSGTLSPPHQPVQNVRTRTGT
jgi:hypothetical protein